MFTRNEKCIMNDVNGIKKYKLNMSRFNKKKKKKKHDLFVFVGYEPISL